MKLHEAITKVLLDNDCLTLAEVASIINRYSLYQRKDSKPIESTQIAARASRYKDQFEVNNSYISLKPRGFEILKNIVDSVGEYLNAVPSSSSHLQEVLLPTLAIFIKFGEKSVIYEPEAALG